MSDVLLVFAKAPEPGRVKTRLVPPLTTAQAAAIYAASLRDVVGRARAAVGEVRICFDPAPGAEDFFQRNFRGSTLTPQSTGDLGRRLTAAAESLFEEGADRVAIIGADSPTLPAGYLLEGLKIPDSADVTLGPATDGGYYLMGIRRAAWPAASALFERIVWSTEHVLEQTLERALTTSLRVHLLPGWYDIDSIADLPAAARDAEPGSELAQLLRSGSWASTDVMTTFQERLRAVT